MRRLNLREITLLAAVGLTTACTKNSNPKTIYDTISVTVTKTDTLRLPPPNDTPNLTDGLVLYLPFTNGSFADSSGLNNQVTAVNGALLGYDMHGYAQSAFTESGNGAVLTVANNGSYAVDTAFSLSFDFMIRSTPYYAGGGNYSGLQCLLSLVDFTNGNGATFAAGFTDPDAPTQFNFAVTSSFLGCNKPTDTSNHFNPGFTPQLGAWYNAICIFSHKVAYTYINGQLATTQQIDTDSTTFCSNASIVIGGWWNATEPLNGAIDEVRMYNKALTSKQIAWLSRNFQINSTARKAGLQQGGKPGLD
ncbi:MAG TPA: LamG domain-containing protein [Puia sp.]|nr:LamG domain-containing protein [Puia sp.]